MKARHALERDSSSARLWRPSSAPTSRKPRGGTATAAAPTKGARTRPRTTSQLVHLSLAGTDPNSWSSGVNHNSWFHQNTAGSGARADAAPCFREWPRLDARCHVTGRLLRAATHPRWLPWNSNNSSSSSSSKDAKRSGRTKKERRAAKRRERDAAWLFDALAKKQEAAEKAARAKKAQLQEKLDAKTKLLEELQETLVG